METPRRDIYPISALTGAGIEALSAAISTAFAEIKSEEDLTLGFDKGRLRAWLHDQNLILSEDMQETGWQITVLWTARQAARFRALV
jgi:GTPase